MVSSTLSRSLCDGATAFNTTLVSGTSLACNLAFPKEYRDACRGSQCLITFDDAGKIDMARTTPSIKAIVEIGSRMQRTVSKQETERKGFWRVYIGLGSGYWSRSAFFGWFILRLEAETDNNA